MASETECQWLERRAAEIEAEAAWVARMQEQEFLAGLWSEVFPEAEEG